MKETSVSGVDRRSFLTQSVFAASAMGVAVPLEALASRDRRHDRPRRGPSPDYGPLGPAIDETTGLPLLLLPKHFRYLSFGWTGDWMQDGLQTPPAHDGMAAFPAGRGRVRLVRNHEVGDGAAFAPNLAYDPTAGGGTVTLEFDSRKGELLGSWASLSGTIRNCAGGPTPWGSWLTCEETTDGIGDGDLTKNHGYIFEVPRLGTCSSASLPLVSMGRFSHEAVAVDPATGDVYETEDAGSNSGFYRFRPETPGSLAEGGVLEMLAITGRPQFDTRTNQTGEWLDADWVTIDDVDPDLQAGAPPLFAQGFAKGGARFGRLEGAWHGNGRIYFVSTSGGNARQGQIFEYDPLDERLRLLFESPSAEVLNAPDNLCVSPRGGLVLCEDGGGTEFVHGLTTDGEIFRFAQNNMDLRATPVKGFSGDYSGSEFAGACYSPDGKWLFVNIQSPGVTVAITGPWRTGAL